ncbi:MAG: peptidoglycan DD-metalloendopeptidase family protein [Anaerolineales bacterium]
MIHTSSKQAGQRVSASLLFVLLAACAPQATPTPSGLPTAQVVQPSATGVELVTVSPTSPAQADLTTYQVQEGDTLSSIAAQFGLQPKTVLWANYEQLFDNPDFLFPGMDLLILPLDGLYHQVGGTDTVDGIAAFFGADAQDLIDWPGNQINAANPVIFAGQWLLVPGGQRFMRNRSMPNLPAYAMAVSPEEFGSGACPQDASQQPAGDALFAWPVSSHEVVGEGYWSAHPGLDLAVEIGEEVRAADGGVVTFSGWSNFGYGYTVMLDHGNGDYSLYSGLGSVTATCGSLLAEGQALGLGGVIGHPAGTFVHFEIRRGEEFLNPLDILP